MLRSHSHLFGRQLVRPGACSRWLPASPPLAQAQAQTEVSFYYPVAVGGPITKIIDGLAADFEKENPGIKLKPIYSGSYQDSITKALTAVKSGEPPVTSILLSTDMFTLIDEDAIVPFDELIKTPDDKAWLKSFYPAFMENSQTGGKTWGIPFQRSTIVLYWNKEMFKEAGLDPNRPPATWKETIEYAQKLTKRDASGKVTQWGVQIPSSGFPYWLFQALAIQNGVNLMNSAGTQTFYDRPEVVEALQYWVDLVNRYKVHPAGHRRLGHHAEGLLREEGRDDVDDDRQPDQRQEQREVRFRRGHAAGGQAARQPDRRRQLLPLQEIDAGAARRGVQVHQWVTTPQRAAQWGIDTGYVAVRADAWDTPAMKQYVAGFPAAAVARDQLPYAKAELSTHDNQRVTKALNDGLQAALTGTKTSEQAMKDAQREAERILRPYRR